MQIFADHHNLINFLFIKMIMSQIIGFYCGFFLFQCHNDRSRCKSFVKSDTELGIVWPFTVEVSEFQGT